MSVLIWGIVMYLFERDKQTMQQSLASSMTFLYHDSDQTTRGWRDFVPFELPTTETAAARPPQTFARMLSVLNERTPSK